MILKIVLLFAIRYQDSNKLGQLLEMLARANIPKLDRELLATLNWYVGSLVRSGALLGNKSIIDITRSSIKRGLKGVSNIYTQHKPLLPVLFAQLMTKKLKDNQFPYIMGGPSKERPNDIFIFIAGGVTYEEALVAAEFIKILQE